MSDYEKSLETLNTEQRTAVEHTEGPQLVIAGPGTGKTQLLSTRAAYILRNRDVLPHNLLCLTFTESGAFAMRQRLVNIIGKKAYNITISTYHAFGSELISRFPDYFTNDIGTEPIDELGMHRIVREIIETLPYDNPLKNGDVYVRDILSMISEAKQALLSPQDLRNVIKTNAVFIAEASLVTKELFRRMVRIDKKSLPLFESLLVKTRGLTTKRPTKGVRSLSDLWNKELQSAIETSTNDGKTTALTEWKNNWLTKNANNEYVVDGERANKKLLALADIYKTYLKRLRSDGLYDFNDMILKAIDGLVENPELKYRLQEQYLYIMLDEFQDTNGAQLQLVSLLTDNPLYERKPNILAVGDDDQAIYAFQGADYSHMRSFIQMYDDVKVVVLTKNYRSQSDILHTAHEIAGQIEERLHHNMPEISKTLETAVPNVPEKAEIARHEFKSDIAQFAWVTKQIASLLKQGTSENEIAVIAPQHKYLEPLVSYLGQADIPVRYEKRENILEEPHILELIRMSQLVIALNNKNEKLADSLWAEVLSFDFWKLPTDLIWDISWRASNRDSSWQKVLKSNKKTLQIFNFFVRLSQISSHETLEKVLDYVIGSESLQYADGQKPYQSPFYEFYFSSKQRNNNQATFWTVLSNITVLRQRLRNAMRSQRSVLYLHDFVAFVADHEAAGIKVLNTSPYHESASAVQLLTAHKAKGLEYENVFVLACTDEAWGSRVRNQKNKISLPKNIQFMRYGGATDDEKLRLLYVAITRAKHSLYLTNYINTYDNKPTNRLKYFTEVETEDGIKSSILPDKYQIIHQTDTSEPSIEDLQSYWANRHIQELSRVTYKDLLIERLERYQISASHISSFTDLVFAGPDYFFLHSILKFPSAPTPQTIFGDVMHETIKWLHDQHKDNKKLPKKSSAINYLESRLNVHALTNTEKQLLHDRGVKSLTALLTQKADDFHAEDEHEVAFRKQGVFVGHAHLTGAVDKLIINKKDRTISVIDFKTGKSFDTWKSSELKLHKFKQQLYFYKLLIEGSQEYGEYTVSDGYIQFVEPNELGSLLSLHLTFTAKELEAMQKLVQVIFNKIKQLDFPDVDSYPATIQGVRSFEADLIKTLP